MKRSYSDYIKTGEMDQLTAIRHQSVRDGAKTGMAKLLAETARQGNPADAAAFGALDVIAVKLVEWYGPADAAKVLRHYADVCERQKPKDPHGEAVDALQRAGMARERNANIAGDFPEGGDA